MLRTGQRSPRKVQTSFSRGEIHGSTHTTGVRAASRRAEAQTRARRSGAPCSWPRVFLPVVLRHQLRGATRDRVASHNADLTNSWPTIDYAGAASRPLFLDAAPARHSRYQLLLGALLLLSFQKAAAYAAQRSATWIGRLLLTSKIANRNLLQGQLHGLPTLPSVGSGGDLGPRDIAAVFFQVCCRHVKAAIPIR